jgi:hypothetical protein
VHAFKEAQAWIFYTKFRLVCVGDLEVGQKTQKKLGLEPYILILISEYFF